MEFLISMIAGVLITGFLRVTSRRVLYHMYFIQVSIVISIIFYLFIF